MADFKIKPAGGAWDAIALGEVMMRLDPGDVPTGGRGRTRIWHGGGETNVAEGLAACFGLRTAVVTALVDDGSAGTSRTSSREAGVDTSLIIWFNTKGKGKFSTDGKGTLHNGINFTWAGKGVLPSVTEYYRAHTPVRELTPGDVDWDALFAQGVRWFHTGGIYTLISPTSSQLALEAMQAAGEARRVPLLRPELPLQGRAGQGEGARHQPQDRRRTSTSWSATRATSSTRSATRAARSPRATPSRCGWRPTRRCCARWRRTTRT